MKQSQAVDRLLSYLEAHWGEVPDIAEGWETKMDGVDKEVFQLEWGIREDNLNLLEDQVSRGNLSDEQFQRYRALQQLIERHRPTLDRLFASG